ncbi:RrF2 family transcriptional regulator [Corynebacterium bovis]|uniref:RrF2 family transcriptional regulator n=1 Tax=Corynebacterium bovis TaxID=36808 RepID=UPI00289A04E0|nr:Rrf2 family transcriptional regulator [Corynebacterium bovis]
MHLTTFADLGLRSLMLMSGRRSTVGRIAVLANASPSHVKKVVARLVDLGVAESVRGRGGGVSLAEGALRTDVGWLLRELEGPGEVVRCGGGAPSRTVAVPCVTGCRRRGRISSPPSTGRRSATSSPARPDSRSTLRP